MKAKSRSLCGGIYFLSISLGRYVYTFAHQLMRATILRFLRCSTERGASRDAETERETQAGRVFPRHTWASQTEPAPRPPRPRAAAAPCCGGPGAAESASGSRLAGPRRARVQRTAAAPDLRRECRSTACLVNSPQSRNQTRVSLELGGPGSSTSERVPEEVGPLCIGKVWRSEAVARADLRGAQLGRSTRVATGALVARGPVNSAFFDPRSSVRPDPQPQPGAVEDMFGHFPAHYLGCTASCRKWRPAGRQWSPGTHFDESRSGRGTALRGSLNMSFTGLGDGMGGV